jgi:hypothetical protein
LLGKELATPPARQARNPVSQTATVMTDRYSVSSGCASSHATTRCSGAVRRGSEMTLAVGQDHSKSTSRGAERSR